MGNDGIVMFFPAQLCGYLEPGSARKVSKTSPIDYFLNQVRMWKKKPRRSS